MESLYRLAASLDHPESKVQLQGRVDQITDYLVYDKGSDAIFKRSPMRGEAQEGYSKENLNDTDYLEATSSVPLFSGRFVQKMGVSLANEIIFFPCSVSCQGQNFNFFAGKTMLSHSFVDSKNSTFHKLQDGTQILEVANYLIDPAFDFFIAREISERSRLIASEKFRLLAKAHNLKLRFLKPV